MPTVTVHLFYFDPETNGFPMPGAKRAELLAIPRTLVASVTMDDQPGIFEAVFAAFNRGSGREHPDLDAKGLRSLSVGDMVQIGTSDACICASTGWEPVDPQPVPGGSLADVLEPVLKPHGITRNGPTSFDCTGLGN